MEKVIISMEKYEAFKSAISDRDNLEELYDIMQSAFFLLLSYFKFGDMEDELLDYLKDELEESIDTDYEILNLIKTNLFD